MVPRPQLFTGLDLGQSQQFTALAVLEQSQVTNPEPSHRVECHYAVRHLERFPLGTPYPEICVRLRQLFAEMSLSYSRLVIDQTGVGQPVVDMIRKASIKARLKAVTISAGQKLTLGRFRVHLRSGDYLVWASAQGKVYKLMSPGQPQSAVILKGHEKATLALTGAEK